MTAETAAMFLNAGRRVRTLIREHRPYAGAASVVFLFAMFVLYAREPMEFVSAEARTSVVAPGAQISIEWEQEWHRRCEGFSTRVLRTAHGELKTLEGVAVRPPDQTGVRMSISTITIPANLPEGQTSLWTTVTMRCWPWGAAYTIVSPRVTFWVKRGA